MTKENETLVEAAFSKQSGMFDQIYAENTIVSYKRQRIRKHVLQYLRRSGSILELNSGTGEDALFFAKKGHQVHATDISEGMQEQLRKKVELQQQGTMISNERCSFTRLQQLKKKGPYDHIFSNFAGLNCTGDLKIVLKSMSPLLKPDGVVTLVILPKFCLWEILMAFKGKFRTAFRRFKSKNGRKAHLEGTYFSCWYYNPSYVINAMKEEYEVLSVEGLCIFVPPSYIEGFAEKHPLAYRLLKNMEERCSRCWPWRSIGDYYIISLVKK